MRTFLITLTLVFSAGLAFAWSWGIHHRMVYLSRDYALLTAKIHLMDGRLRPGLVIFGDSAVMDGILPERLGPDVLNCGMSGCTPIESYFLIRRLLKSPVPPLAVLLSYNAYHFVHPDFYWENSVKFGLIKGSDADRGNGQDPPAEGQGTDHRRGILQPGRKVILLPAFPGLSFLLRFLLIRRTPGRKGKRK